MILIVLPPALDEAQAAAAYYEDIRRELEEAFRAELAAALESIASMPHAWSALNSRYRFLLLRRFRYKVVYRIADAHAVVVAVAHTSRRPRYWRGR